MSITSKKTNKTDKTTKSSIEKTKKNDKNDKHMNDKHDNDKPKNTNARKKLIGYHLPKDIRYYQVKYPDESDLYMKMLNAINETKTRSFQLFLKSPQSLSTKIKLNDKDKEKCKALVEEKKLKIVNHSSYMINFARPVSQNKPHRAAVIDDLININAIGGIGSIIHVGKCVESQKLTCDQGTKNMRSNMEKVIDQIISLKLNANLILETGAGQGTELFTAMEDLGAFYHSFSKKYKEHLRICIDTCHVFSGGYDLRTEEKVKEYIALVKKHIGWENVACIHLNDSQVALGARVDRHQNFKKGYITFGGMGGIKCFVNFCAKKKIPMMMETPIPDDPKDFWEQRKNELAILKKLLD